METPPMTLLLVDGHYYLYRSFYAIRGLKDSKGRPTNAIYAFVKALRRMLADIKPTHGAVLWDCGLPEHRVALQPEYKQQREPMPDDLEVQEQSVMDLCPHLGMQSVLLEGVEADDLIAAYTRKAGDSAEVIIATNDKDILQLTSSGTRIYSTAKADLELCGRPAGSFALLGPEEVEKKWGVAPQQIGEVLSLTGDSSDNIPGVPGVGPKTAVALIRQFGTVAELLENLDAVSNPKLREKLSGHREEIFVNREMVRLQETIELPVPIEGLNIRPDLSALAEVLRVCEFQSLLREVEQEAAASRPEDAQSKSSARVQGELFSD